MVPVLSFLPGGILGQLAFGLLSNTVLTGNPLGNAGNFFGQLLGGAADGQAAQGQLPILGAQALADGKVSISEAINIAYDEFSKLEGAGVDLRMISDTSELSMAYEKLGLNPEEASDRALRVTLLLDAAEQKLENGDLSAGLDPSLVNILQNGDKGQLLQLTDASRDASLESFNKVNLAAQLPTDVAKRILQGQHLTQVAAAAPSQQQQPDDAAADRSQPDAAAASVADAQQGATAGDASLAETLPQISERPHKGESLGELFKQIAARAKDGEVDSEVIAKLDKMSQLSERLLGNANQDSLKPVMVAAWVKTKDSKPADTAPAVATPKIAAENLMADESKAENLLHDAKQTLADRVHHATHAAPAPAPAPAGDNAQQHIAQAAKSGTSPVVDSNPQITEAAHTVYIAQPSPDGGVQLVDAKTGEVLQTASSHNQLPPRVEGVMDKYADIVAQARLDNQVRVHVRTLAKHGGGQIEVGLNPAELGRIQVKLQIEDGTVHGAITVQRPEVMEQLGRDMRALEQALQDVGLKMSAQGLALQLENNNSGNNGGGQQYRQDQPQVAAFRPAEDEGIQEISGVWSSPDRLVDVRI